MPSCTVIVSHKNYVRMMSFRSVEEYDRKRDLITSKKQKKKDEKSKKREAAAAAPPEE